MEKRARIGLTVIKFGLPMTPIHYAMPNLDRKGLRNFGLITGSIVAVLFSFVFPLVVRAQNSYLALGAVGSVGWLGVTCTFNFTNCL